MASNYPDEGLPANEDGDFRADLPFRTGGNDHPAHTEARAELRDRETYYAELRFAVHCQSRSNPSAPWTPSIPAPRVALDDEGSATWTRGNSARENSAPEIGAHDNSARENKGPEGESWDDMIARFGDTWT